MLDDEKHLSLLLVELNKFRRELLSNRNWSPAFDSRMVDLLVDYFQRVRLAHLSSLEQMYLLALADTLANASNDSLSSQIYAGQRPSSKTRLDDDPLSSPRIFSQIRWMIVVYAF
jgi:hypothetical protein